MGKVSVEIDELKKHIITLLDHVKAVHGGSVSLDEDYYWNIDEESLYKVTEDPETLSMIGSLYEDWEFLRETNEDDPALMLLKVAPLLRYIGNKVGL